MQPRVAFLREKVKYNADSFMKRRRKNRLRAFSLTMMITLCGSLTTVLLGLKNNSLFSKHEPLISAIALGTSALVTFASTWDSFFDYRWLWIRYTQTLGNLYGILDDLDYATAGREVTSEQLDALYLQFQRTLEETNTAWIEKRERESTLDKKREKPINSSAK
jgi:hypothetical protein